MKRIFWSCVFLLTGAAFCSKDVDCNDSSTYTLSKTGGPHQKLWEMSQQKLGEYTACASTNCSCYFNTLEKDLMPFKEITLEMVKRVGSRGTRYLIYNHKLYRSNDCSFPARCAGIEHFLLQLLPKLPDVDFILNPRDWPQISKHFGDKGPVFSFSKTPDYLDIQYPAWSFWEGGPAIKSYPTGLGRWDKMSQLLDQESQKWPWHSKLQKGFFRGSRTSEERDALVLLSRAHPNTVDAQYTKNQAWKSLADTLHAEPADEVPLEDHCRYKYLFNYRGVAASFRFKHLFLCGSLVVHFGDDWTEFFYDSLKPWVHYVPMAADASEKDIMAMIEFLHEHDSLAREIATRGQEFIKTHLRLKDVKCYWKNLLKRYAKLIKYPISYDPELQEIR